MSRRDLLIGCVGKPSAGKSSFLNATTSANAKVGNYPFTTIAPNQGIGHYTVSCPCAEHDLQAKCKPRYGKCLEGTRYIPVKILDVAGLVPGASTGLGLGNKFLDDLRSADVLLHIIDVSGTTNSKGEATTGYDPIDDIEWLDAEIREWIFNNLWSRWPSIVRRSLAIKASAVDTFQTQLSGYGTKVAMVQKVMDKLKIKEPAELEKWDEDRVRSFVKMFVSVRFPTVYVLNKIDHPASDGNILKICERYGEERVVLCSALTECFLKRMAAKNFIRYNSGEGDFALLGEEGGEGLKELDIKTKRKLEKIRDLVLFRYGGTGVQDAIARAVEVKKFIPIYPVANIKNFTANTKGKGCFLDCILVPPKSTVRDCAKYTSSDIEKFFSYAEGTSGQRLGEDDIVTEENNILRFVTTRGDADSVAPKPTNKPTEKKKKG